MFGLSTPMLVVSLALVASLTGNALIGRAYLGARDTATQATNDAKNSRDAARSCSDGVSSLQAAAEQRASQAEAARDEANAKALTAQRRAQNLLTARPSVPADDCRSAAVQMDDWLTGKGAK